jgi:tRNA threonylcarbamoyladenosine biosynthesis protein TsaB
MTRMLLIETATKNCSVGLVEAGALVAVKELATDGYVHAEQLHMFIEETMAQAGIGPNDLDAVAISSGPGSYTGLRIGTAAAKGLCFALNIPLIAIPTSDVLFEMANKISTTDLIITLLDARRMDAYVTGYNTSGEILMPTGFFTLTDPLPLDLSGKVVGFIGDAAEKAQDVFSNSKFNFLQSYPTVSGMVVPALQRWESKTFEDLAYFEPFYLKAFEAGKKKQSLQ